MKKRVLFLSPVFPYPLTRAFNIHIHRCLRFLSQMGFETDVVAITSMLSDEEREKSIQNIQPNCKNVYVFPVPQWKHYLRTALNIFSAKPMQVHYYKFLEIQNWVNESISSYDLIFCNTIRMASYVEKFSLPKVIDFHDAFSLRYGQFAGKNMRETIFLLERSRCLNYELRAAKKFSACFITSHKDKLHLVRHGADAEKIIVCPPAVSDDWFKNSPAQGSPDKNNLCFLGTMNYAPNEDAVLYFVKKVFPLVKKEILNAKFYIIGLNPSKEIRELNSSDVVVTGWVDNPVPFISKAKVFVAPLRVASGIQNKVLQALAMGKAVVTTSGVAGSIGLKHMEHASVADNPNEMAQAIIILLRDESLRKKLGEEGRKFIRENYTEDVTYKIFSSVIQKIM